MKSQFNRSAIYVALGLSIALVVGVLFGAKWVYDHTELEPVAVAPVPSDKADSAECQAFIDALPETFQGHRRADIADPVPDGVAAWASNSVDSITARCGVDLPAQYTELAQTEKAAGATWLPVKDMTPGSGLTSWYTVDRSPAAVITTFEDDEPAGLDEAVAALPESETKPSPAPLSQLGSAEPTGCDALDDALPRDLADDYTRADPESFDGVDLPEHTAVWTAPRREPIVLRCGVKPPAGYKPGERVQQVNDVPWFEDTTLAKGTTSGTWYALGRATDIAVSLPQDAADGSLVKLSDAIAEATPEEK
ncbi:DUF3515 domain-containing protein [Corynebacterium massiliense]|uniref:DUF3515 domain-containing protein n=1 Tax=Corynebacterium massiliense DSM 45435 TaxID=1121364 RepID=A0ABY7U9E8_9CORY|nr:DUF3515 domain-containing protein [Corynebacterium massiliense]WCZ32397.1 hypothetical protein CMASS_04750 [Corynebacterium massiliense DSM 45435]